MCYIQLRLNFQQQLYTHIVLQLEYFSDIPRTSGRTPDVQLRAIDVTLCIIGHLTPNLGECPDVFPFCYNSNISLISCGRPVGLQTSNSAQWPRHFCIIRQLAPDSAERSNGFPFCYDSNISLIYCGRPVGLQMSDSVQWPRHFLYYRTTRAQLSRVFRCFSFHNISPFLLPDLFHCCLAYPISDISRGTCI